VERQFVLDGGMATGLALVRLFTEQWGAEVQGYDTSPSGDVIVDLILPTGGLRRTDDGSS
jgi:hypothetical protein